MGRSTGGNTRAYTRQTAQPRYITEAQKRRLGPLERSKATSAHPPPVSPADSTTGLPLDEIPDVGVRARILRALGL